MRSQKIAFITGKGGTGKSMVALSLAYNQATKGQRVLLLELGESSFFQFLSPQKEIGFEPSMVRENLWVAKWDGPTCLRDYILYLVRSETILKVIFDNPFMKTLIDVGPSLSELAIVGKITSGIREVGPPLDFDVIVVDAYATGHMLALIRAPIGIAEAVKVGPMATQCRDILRVLKDPKFVSYHIVTLAEELAVAEACELWDALHLEIGVRSEFVTNRRMMPPLNDEQLNDLSKKDLPGGAKDFIRYLTDKKSMEAEQIEKLSGFKTTRTDIPHFLINDPVELMEKMAWYMKI